MQLDSNFRDWYDFAFERSGPVYTRDIGGGMSRPEMFEYMQSLDLDVPAHGTVQELAARYRRDPDSIEAYLLQHNILQLVVYLDERAHCGEGKTLLDIQDALQRYPNHYCSQHIPATPTGLGSTLRYLHVGQRRWWLRYNSLNDWRSNVGDVEIEVMYEEKPGYHPRIKLPMFAIDFVHAGAKLYAIDFNEAPGLDPLNGRIPASEIVAQLKLLANSTRMWY